MTRIQTFTDKCSAMRHPGNQVKRRRARNGSWQIFIKCERCDRIVTPEITGRPGLFLSKEAALRRLTDDATLEDIPVDANPRELRVCYLCNAIAECEDDHVAERTIHGDMAELLPIVPLCPKCHDQKTKNLQEFMRKMRGGSAA